METPLPAGVETVDSSFHVAGNGVVYSFLWLFYGPLHIRCTSSVSIHLWMGVLFASMSSLLETVRQ